VPTLHPSDVFHYTMKVFREVYPVTTEEYRRQSLRRRASYSYLNEILEAGHQLLGDILTHRGQGVAPSYRGRIKQAEAAGIIPHSLATDLLKLKTLRNLATHENPRVNKALAVHKAALTLASVGFAFFALDMEWLAIVEGSETRRAGVVIDREYLLGWLRPLPVGPEENPSEREYRSNLDYEEGMARARACLDKERHVPRYELDFSGLPAGSPNKALRQC